jgi:hypothetical protein
MNQPDVQRISLIGVRGQPDDIDARVEAVELRSEPGRTVTADDAIDRALAIVNPRSYTLRDSRAQSNWGATGLQLQDIVILYGVAVTAEITARALVAAFVGATGALGSPAVDSADAAWEVFSDFLTRCFEIAGATMVEATNDRGTWRLVATVRGRQFEGTVSSDGRVLEARRLDTTRTS